jgi:hypothetical protein
MRVRDVRGAWVGGPGTAPRQSLLLDMCLLPLLAVRSTPPFPHCSNSECTITKLMTAWAWLCAPVCVCMCVCVCVQLVFSVVVGSFDRTVAAYFRTHSRFVDDTAPNKRPRSAPH